jgi:hypothetical protein
VKSYPTIEKQIIHGINIIAWDKIDGSQIRVEWNRKQGFYKFGSRKVLIGEDSFLKEAIFLIKGTYEQTITNMFKKEQIERAICFFEFYGNNSAFGQHIQEPHNVILFDIAPYKKGLMLSPDFLRLTSKYDIRTPKILYRGNFTHTLYEAIKNSTLPNMTFEGAVCKGTKDKQPLMFKIKSNAWLTKLRNYCKGDEKLFKELE